MLTLKQKIKAKQRTHQAGLITLISNEFQMLILTSQMLFHELHWCHLSLHLFNPTDIK